MKTRTYSRPHHGYPPHRSPAINLGHTVKVFGHQCNSHEHSIPALERRKPKSHRVLRGLDSDWALNRSRLVVDSILSAGLLDLENELLGELRSALRELHTGTILCVVPVCKMAFILRIRSRTPTSSGAMMDGLCTVSGLQRMLPSTTSCV